jgi:hypothetical protein
LALALSAGLGLAQLTRDEATPTSARATFSDAHAVSPAQTQARAEAPQQVLYIYVAGTEEQAAQVRQFSAELNALRAELGQPSVSVGVLVAGPESAWALEGLAGTPGTRFFDLRAP